MIISGSSACSLCGEVLEEKEEHVLIPSFLENESHPLFKYTDTGYHKDCFEKWGLREELVAEFNRFHKSHYRGMRVMNNQGIILENNGKNI